MQPQILLSEMGIVYSHNAGLSAAHSIRFHNHVLPPGVQTEARSASKLPRGAAADPKNLVPGDKDVAIHQLARSLGVTVVDCVQDFAVLANRELSVVPYVNCGIHDPLHLAANRFDRLEQELVPRRLCDADVEV